MELEHVINFGKGMVLCNKAMAEFFVKNWRYFAKIKYGGKY